MGTSAIIRMSFVLACFHFLVFAVILSRGQAASIFHDGCWLFKSMFVLGFFIATMWIPNGFFKGYLEMSRYVSIMFLMYQALLMLVVAYKVNETLVGNYERNGDSCSQVIIIGTTVFFTGISVVWLGY
jgi:hypothetical protein